MALFRRNSPQPNVEASDEDVVLLAQHGNRDAFGVLYDRYLPRVYGYCYRMLGDRESAEDANTEVWVRALGGIAGSRPAMCCSTTTPGASQP